MSRVLAERAIRVEPQYTMAGLKRRFEDVAPFKVAGRMRPIDRRCLSPQFAGAALIASRPILSGRAEAAGARVSGQHLLRTLKAVSVQVTPTHRCQGAPGLP